LSEDRNGFWNHGVTGRRDANLSRTMIANPGGCRPDRIKALKSDFDLVVEQAAFRRGHQAIADARKEWKAYRSFELDDASADSWLRYAKRFRCPRGGATPHHRGERLNLTKIHIPSPCRPQNPSLGRLSRQVPFKLQ